MEIAHACASGFRSRTQLRPQGKKLLLGRALRGALNLPVARNERMAERRKDRAAPVLAADSPLDGGAPTDAIDLVHQMPGLLISHLHRAAGGRDRTVGIN